MKNLYQFVATAFLGIVATLIVSSAISHAQPNGAPLMQVTAPVGQPIGSWTSTYNSTPASSTTVTLTAASSQVTIYNHADSVNLHISPNNVTATTSMGMVEAGHALTFQSAQPITAFKVIGDSATGHYSVFAH